MAQDGAWVLAKACAGGTAIGPIAKLNDAVAAVVGGARVHAVAFHQGQARKVVRLEFVFFGHLQNFVHHGLFFVRGNKALVDRTLQGFVQHRVGADIAPGFELHLCAGRDPSLGRVGGAGLGQAQAGLGVGSGPVQGLLQGRQVDALARVDQVGIGQVVAAGHLLGQAHGLSLADIFARGGHELAHDAAQGVAGLHGHAGRLRAQDACRIPASAGLLRLGQGALKNHSATRRLGLGTQLRLQMI